MNKENDNIWLELLQNTQSRQSYAERLYAADGEIGSFITIDTERGYQLMKETERSTEFGSIQADKKDLLQVPFAVKDNIALESFRLPAGRVCLKSLFLPIRQQQSGS